ncbi:MAG TPA: type VI secretion system accessory protein TagJ, partial [Burkholderiales bacterium]|nr:type VI secretion system accessory protein TagJ [Burkholderiales bacterium]
MTPLELLRAGRLDETLAALQQEIRKKPGDGKLRVFLFQLLAVLGQWERALAQLQVAGELDPAALPMVQTYREALRCEFLRQEIFAGKRAPMVFGDPDYWLALLLESLRLSADGEHGKAQPLRDKAFELAPATAGSLNGQRFEWIADADARLGPVIEAVINGRYYWVPFHRVRSIRIEDPADLRDTVWMPAEFRWANGGQVVGLIPTRYEGTAAAADDALRLARRTEWIEQGEGAYVGLGQRMFATDVGEYALMDVRSIELDPISADAGTAEPTTAADEAG